MDIELASKNIQNFVDIGNYHAAINTAISAMNACRKEKNQVGVDYFIGVIRKVVDAIDDEFGS